MKKSLVILSGNQLEILKILNEPMTARGIGLTVGIHECHVYTILNKLERLKMIERKSMSLNINYGEVYTYTRTEKGNILKGLFE